ncbi:M56 family metallopeptidase [Chitinophaga sp. MM2321]|uniref:M56 family metallopeptidase n=1 Tax=Chitinophaga sp. MM2321 TaxID=3137178 RepID=UPI0032D5751C
MNLLPFTGDLVHALGWTILHAIWQAFFVYACLKIVLKLWPMASARIKYNLSMFSLAGIFTWFLITLYQQLQVLSQTKQLVLQLSAQQLAITGQPLPAVYQGQEEMATLFPSLEMCLPVLVALYIAGMAVMIIKLVSDLLQLQQIRTKQVESMGEAWENHLEHLVAQLQLPRKVQLLVSRYIQVPVMLGFFKPVILLPIAMVNNLSEEQLEAILLHELAHIKRNDYLLNIFQSIVETILFFNPFVWLISKTIRQEREHCCDDLVIAGTVQPLHYARALIALEEYRLTANPLTMAIADNKQHLFHRIKRIMEMKTKHLNYSQKFLAVLIIATGLVSIAWLNPGKVENHGTLTKEKDHAVAEVPREIQIPAADTVAPQPVFSATPAPTITATPSVTTVNTTPNVNINRDIHVVTNIDAASDIHTNLSFHAVPVVFSPMSVNLSPMDVNLSPMDVNLVFDTTAPQKLDNEDIRQQVIAAQKNVQQAMKQLRDVDLKRIQAEARAATEKVDWKALSEETKKAQLEATNALKSIDWEKINKEVQEAYNKVDWKDINNKVSKTWTENKIIIEKSMKEARNNMMAANKNKDAAIREEVRANTAKTQAEREERVAEISRKNAELAKVRAERNQLFAEDAKVKAEATNKKYRELISKMGSDNLLDTDKPYTIEKNSSGLFINGVKQPDSVQEKYKGYLNSKHVTIKKTDDDNFNINIED